MAVTALVLYAIWFLLAFGLRTALALRRTGDSGFRGVSGRPFSLKWCAGILFAVALLLGVVAPVASLTGLAPLTRSAPVSWVGLGTTLAGITLTLVAQLAMGDSWRIGVDQSERTALVTSDAFAVARNPIFTAMAVTAGGLAMMVPNVVAAVGMACLLAALELQVRNIEEPYLLTVHGDDYLSYASRVGRFIPGIGRLDPLDELAEP